MFDKYRVAVYCRLGNEPKLKAAIYCRVASENNDIIRSQEEQLRQYAMSQLLDVGAVYPDNGASGITLNRPAFKRMMRAINDGVINCVIVKDLGRISRDFLQTGKWIDSMKDKNIQVIAVSDMFDSFNTDNIFGAILKDIIQQTFKEMPSKIKAGIANKKECEAASAINSISE